MVDSVVAGRPRWSIAPYLVVDDVVATANYYRDKLGFGYERFWGEPPPPPAIARKKFTFGV